MCAQPSLPVVPDNSAAPRGDDGGRSEDSKGWTKPGVGLSSKKPAVRSGARKPGVGLGSELLLQPPKKPVQKTRCTKCGSKTHPTSKCVENVRKCARCSDVNNSQQCQIVVMRTRLMKTFRNRGDHRQVQSTLLSVRKDGHRPAKESYTLLLSSLVASGRIGEGPFLLQQMEEDRIVPDAIFFNTLLNGYCEAGKLSEAEALILEMKERDVPLTASTYNTLIKGYGLARQPDEAMKLLQEMGKSDTSKPNDRTFNMLIKVWAQDKNPEKARHVISLMRAAGVGPDVVSYNTLAQLFARLGKPWDAEKVIVEMQNAYLRPNERTYGIIINGFIAAGLIEESLPLLKRMKMEGIPPTVAVFNHLVKGYSEAMQPEGIDKVFELMGAYGVKPDVQTFGLIMNAWCNTGFIDEAKAALLRMREYDLQPDVMAYSILAKGYSRQGRPKEGEELLKTMIDDSLTPNVVTYTTVISGYCSLAQMDDAMRVFQAMRSRFVAPNMQTFRTLIWGFKEARWPRRAEEILEYIRKAGFTPDPECIELVADCWRSIGVHEEADRVLAGIQPKDHEHGDANGGISSRPDSLTVKKYITKPGCGVSVGPGSVNLCKLGSTAIASNSSPSRRRGHGSPKLQSSAARLWTGSGSPVRMIFGCASSAPPSTLRWRCQVSWSHVAPARGGRERCGPLNSSLCNSRILLGGVSRVVGQVVQQPALRLPTLQPLLVF